MSKNAGGGTRIGAGKRAMHVPLTGSEREAGLREHGFAADRPNGPRTQDGHALASRMRRADPEVDWDAWVRAIEDQAAALGSEREAGLDETAMAFAIHDVFHSGPPLLSCMTKHRLKARKMLASLAVGYLP